MSQFRTFGEAQEEYYRNHPNEIDEFLTVAFEEYSKDMDIGALLSALRMIHRVKGTTCELK